MRVRHRLASALLVLCSTAAQPRSTPNHPRRQRYRPLNQVRSTGHRSGSRSHRTGTRGSSCTCADTARRQVCPGTRRIRNRISGEPCSCRRGFAFAESGYSANGWAVKEGIEDTEALRRYFVTKLTEKHPKHTSRVARIGRPHHHRHHRALPRSCTRARFPCVARSAPPF